jgi:hypothetical protein
VLLLLLLLQVVTGGESIENSKTIPLQIIRPLSQASLPPSLFGEGWERSKGIVADDLDKLADLPEAALNIMNQLKPELTRLGVVGVADYSVVRTKWPLNTVTVRVFVFSDIEKCDESWQKKYQFDGWQKHYKVVDNNRYAALDSLQKKFPHANKRVLKFDRVWITTHQLGDGNEHLKAAEHIIEQLTESEL